MKISQFQPRVRYRLASRTEGCGQLQVLRLAKARTQPTDISPTNLMGLILIEVPGNWVSN